MECLNIDFICPFPDGGYILVIVDTFTRWVELFPTPDATAASAAQALLQHFGRFGAPHQLRSDNGPHFIADLIREFLFLIGTQYCLTLAYSKQENSIVERYKVFRQQRLGSAATAHSGGSKGTRGLKAP